jgi:hypothetical protein
MIIKTVDKSKFVIITIILLAFGLMIGAFTASNNKWYANKTTIEGITFSYEKLPTKQNETMKVKIYNGTKLPIVANMAFQHQKYNWQWDWIRPTNTTIAEAKVIDLKPGETFEGEISERGTVYKGNYRLIVSGWHYYTDDIDGKEFQFWGKRIAEFEIK